jgi:hypothetical protein
MTVPSGHRAARNCATRNKTRGSELVCLASEESAGLGSWSFLRHEPDFLECNAVYRRVHFCPDAVKLPS